MSRTATHSVPTIGLYNRIEEVKEYTPIELNDFLVKIKKGHWEDLVCQCRVVKEKAPRDAMKKSILPYATICGEFRHRSIDGLKLHSGFIAIDLDSLEDINSVKDKLIEDDYVYSIFLSVSGRGVCVIFKIDGKKHRQAFAGLCFYLYDKYGLLADHCGDVSRARFVSYDPDLFVNNDAKVFDQYQSENKEEEKHKKRFPPAIFVPKDFKEMIAKLAPYNVFENYSDWVSGGFALISKFGEDARPMFHKLSEVSPKYSPEECDRKFDNLLKSDNQTKEKTATLGTIYWLASKYNIQPLSKDTNIAINNSIIYKSAGIDSAGAITKLVSEGVHDESAKAIVEHTYINNIQLPGSSLTDVIEIFLQKQGEFRYNEISNKTEFNGEPVTDKVINEIWRNLSKLEPKATKEKIQAVIESDFPTRYNPFKEFYNKYKAIQCYGIIDKYISCFEVKDPNIFKKLFKKWYVSIIASSYGKHSPLVLVLIGGQGTGKTETFRRLLPPELSLYYAESRLDAGKDDEILMTQKLLICDDEFGGKSKQESKKLKELTSKQIFTVRAPYGRYNVDMRRLAVLCGTANEKEVLVDPTGNRRILPIEVISIDYDRINKIDRIALFMEAHKEYLEGFNTELSRDDVKDLNDKTKDFEQHNIEYELINKYFRIPADTDKDVEEFTATEIKMYLESRSVNQKLNLNKIGQQLKKIGFIQESKRDGTTTNRLYKVVKRRLNVMAHFTKAV